MWIYTQKSILTFLNLERKKYSNIQPSAPPPEYNF